MPREGGFGVHSVENMWAEEKEGKVTRRDDKL